MLQVQALPPRLWRHAAARFVAIAVLFPVAAQAQIAAGQNRYVRYDYAVAPDKSYVETRTVEVRLANAVMAADAGTASFDFDPADEALEVLEAWVDHPDAGRVVVPPASIYTRPSAAARNSPGFVATQTTTVVFPQLQVGSVLHTKWRHTVKSPRLFGFNAVAATGLEPHAGIDIRIQAPVSLPLQWRERGGFNVDASVTGTGANATRVVTAAITTGAMPPPEPFMVAPADVSPVFVATTLASYEEMGAIYAARSAGKAVVTPEIATLARSIAGGASGLAAARAVHDWVAANIRYVAVYLDPADDLVPHDAATVLRNGYGDCKDHVVLVQALLQAVGVRAEAALINWDNRMQPLPLWSAAAFNHAMVYLPDFDVYANTTDPYAAFGALDILLSGKLTVIASGNGAQKQTPSSGPEQNVYRAQSELAIDPSGTVTGNTTLNAAPRPETALRRAVATGGSPQALATRLLAPTPEGGFGSIHASNPRDLSQPLRLTGNWTSPHGVVPAGSTVYMTIPLGIDMTPSGDLRAYLAATGSRHYPVMIGARDHRWTYRISLPAGARVVHLPPDTTVRTAAGEATARYAADGQGVTVARQLVLPHDVYMPEDYPALQTLLYAHIDAQRAVMAYQLPAAASAAPPGRATAGHAVAHVDAGAMLFVTASTAWKHQ